MAAKDGNGTTPAQLIEVVGSLKLDGSPDCGELFLVVLNTDEQSVERFCDDLRGDRELVVLLVCVWMLVQAGKQNQSDVVPASEEALHLLGDRAATDETLIGVIQENWGSIIHDQNLSKHFESRFKDKNVLAAAAERLLTHLVG